jgi:hypothetical protein
MKSYRSSSRNYVVTVVRWPGKPEREARLSPVSREWRINETKSVHIDFTNKRIEHKPIYINNHAVPYENTAKYLGMTLDAKLRWKLHVKKKRKNSN